MSNIEPTVTRTMRCTSCNAVGVHTIDASMINEPVLCPTCAESGKRSVCVANNEPTEEQKQAAREACRSLNGSLHHNIARLLAEREAKLREELEGERSLSEQLFSTNGTLRARVAELEVHANTAMDNRDAHKAYAIELEEREAQHLADIKALREALASVCIDILTSPSVTDTMWSHRSGLSTTNDYIASVLGIDTVDAYGKPTAELARLAHYDDAKAAEGGVDRLTKGET